MTKGLLKALTALLFVWLSACAPTPTAHFYRLEALAPIAPLKPAQSKPRTIGVGPVTIPRLFDREEMVALNGNRVEITGFERWAAPLSDSVVQVLQQNLARQLPQDTLRAYPWSAFGSVDQRIVLEITRFDALLGISVTIEANWAVIDEASHHFVASGRSLVTQPLTDSSYASVARAFSQTLSQLGFELSAAVKKVPTPYSTICD